MNIDRDMNNSDRDFEEDQHEHDLPEDYLTWEDIEYIDTFLPRNLEF